MASFLTTSLPYFPSSHKTTQSPTKYRLKVSKFPSNNHRKHNKSLPFVRNFPPFSFQAAPRYSKDDDKQLSVEPATSRVKQEVSFSLSGYFPKPDKGVIQCLTGPIVYALFCIAVGFHPLGALPARAAVAVAPVAGEVAYKKRGKQLNKEANCKEHEFSEFTRRLLEEVSRLLKCVAEVRRANGSIEDVELELKEIKVKKEELKRELMEGMYAEVRELRKERFKFQKHSYEIMDEVEQASKEYEVLKGKDEKKRVELEERMSALDEEYDEVSERMGQIDDDILRRETMALSVGVRELCFIARECEELLKRLSLEMRQRSTDSQQKRSGTKLSKSEIQEELVTAQRKLLEEAILPNVVEVEGPGPLLTDNLMDFAARIRQRLNESRKLQKDVEAHIRKRMKRFGDEKRFVVKTPEDEVVKGFPEVELKWMFGDKEVIVPKAIRNHLYHGWKKWREEAKADLKRKLLEDVDFGKQYVAQKQERILLDRDRVISKTWYTEDKKRWEMDPIAVPYAVSKKLVEHARIKHDWGAMYISLEGDGKEYYVDIKAPVIIFVEDFDLFAGVRGKFIHTKKQDHEAFINQLLVELDG